MDNDSMPQQGNEPQQGKEQQSKLTTTKEKIIFLSAITTTTIAIIGIITGVVGWGSSLSHDIDRAKKDLIKHEEKIDKINDKIDELENFRISIKEKVSFVRQNQERLDRDIHSLNTAKINQGKKHQKISNPDNK